MPLSAVIIGTACEPETCNSLVEKGLLGGVMEVDSRNP